MNAAKLFRLRRLLGVAVTSEKARLAGVLAEIAACRRRATELRRRIGAGPALPECVGEALGAVGLEAEARWCLRLGERARAEAARVTALERQAEECRRRLARASGRESAVAAMAEKAREDERRLAERRAEGNVPPHRRQLDHSSESCSSLSGVSAGSPGIA
jgi:hypothetical protein